MGDKGLLPMLMTGNLSLNWEKWRRRFENYLIATDLCEKPEKKQCAVLLHYIGEECEDIYSTFTFTTEETNKINFLLQKFEDYFKPKRNITYERYKFFTRKQQQHETVDQFVTVLKKLASTCEFGNLKNDLIKDLLICGLQSNVLRETLLKDTDLDLEKAINVCRTSEIAKQQSSVVTMETGKTEEIHRVAVASSQERQRRNNNEESSRTYKQCYRCGGRYHIKSNCPAMGKICNLCKKENHYAKVCKTKSRNVNVVTSNEVENVNCQNENNNLFLGIVNQINYVGKEWSVEVIFMDSNKKENFKIDTGAQANCMSLNTFRKIGFNENILEKTNIKLSNYCGTFLDVLGKCFVKCQVQDKVCQLEFHVISNNAPPVLGLPTCDHLNIVKRMCVIETSDIVKENNDLFEGLGCLKMEPYNIKLDKNVAPVIHAPRKVPFLLMNKLKDELTRLEKLKIITKVTEPTPWVNSLVIVRKPNGDLRLCLDPKDLNKAILREHYQLPTVEQIFSKLENAQYFSILDCSQGFWQIVVDESSSKLFTFNTPFGRFRFLRLPYGISCAPEIFSRIIKQLFEDMEGVDSYVDDILVWGSSLEEHNERLDKVLKRIKENNLKLNKNKCKFGVKEIKYMGHKITSEGISPDNSKISAIVNMQQPTDKKSLERFLGMVNYVGRFISNLAEISAPLRKLLKKNIMFYWEREQEDAFQLLKKKLIEKPVLKYFQIHEPVTISVDASLNGIGAVLLQNNVPVAYGSKSLTECQKRWAQIEKELYAIVFGCEKFSQYVYAKEVITVETDHKPLVHIMNKPLVDCPLRLQRMLIRLQPYKINLIYKPGKELLVADCLSRAFEKNNGDENALSEQDIEAHVCIVNLTLPITDRQRDRFKLETEKDEIMQILKNYIRNGWPNNIKNVDDRAKPYFQYRAEITESDNLIFKNSLLIVPRVLRKEMLDRIHYGHLGIEKCKSRARECLFWPQMTNDLVNLIQSCESCSIYRKSNTREPMISHEIPERPWQKVGMDIFELNGFKYLILIDYYSKFVEIALLKNDTTSSNVINHLKSIFSRHGIPEILVSDQGTQLNSKEFHDFATEWDFKNVYSSPTHAQSNGMAERAIQTVKGMLRKGLREKKDLYLILLEYRNTPLQSLGTPSELLMGRRLRGILPLNKKMLTPKIIKSTVVRNVWQSKQEKQRQYYNRGVKDLPELKTGNDVRVQRGQQWYPGVICNKLDNKPRTYNIKMDNGSVLERNRKYISPQPKTSLFPLCTNFENNIEATSPKFNRNVTRYGRIVKPPERLKL